MKKTRVTLLLVTMTAATMMLAQPSIAAPSKPNKALCGVVDQGFTYFPNAEGSGGTVSFGVVVRNVTAKTAVNTKDVINLLSPTGKVVKTVMNGVGADYLAPKDTVRGGTTIEVGEPVASMKVMFSCAVQSAAGRKLQKGSLIAHAPFSGTVASVEDYSQTAVKLTGMFTNGSKGRNYTGTPTYIVRDASGRIIGGENLATGTFDGVPAGVEVAWDDGVSAPLPIGATVEGSAGAWGAIYN